MLIFLKAEEIGIEPIYTDLESAAFLKLLQAELYTTYKSKYISTNTLINYMGAI